MHLLSRDKVIYTICDRHRALVAPELGPCKHCPKINDSELASFCRLIAEKTNSIVTREVLRTLLFYAGCLAAGVLIGLVLRIVI